MLYKYSVENFMSIKLEESISLKASPLKKYNEYVKDNGLLPVISIYGPNGGGKSALISSVSYLIRFIGAGNIPSLLESINILKNKTLQNEPTKWHIEFLNDEGELLIYDLWVNNTISYESYEIKNKKGKSTLIFSYENTGSEQKFKFCEEIKKLKINTNNYSPKNTMLNFLASIFDIDDIVKLTKELRKIRIADLSINLGGTVLQPFGIRMSVNYDYDFIAKEKSKILKIFKELDVRIDDLEIVEDVMHKKIYSIKHTLFDEEIRIPFELESSGTKKLLQIICDILKALSMNAILFVDELDANLHTKLLRYIVTIFNKNSSQAQLIYTSHDMGTLDKDLFRKDQIYFAALNEASFTNIICLNYFGDSIRGGVSFSKKYMDGKIGYDPYIQYGMDWLNGK